MLPPTAPSVCWEFRIWAQDLTQVRREFERIAIPQRPEITPEIYLLSQTTDRCSAKMRSGTLDLKVLLEERDGLERWAPLFKAAFPLSRAVIADQLFPALALDPPTLSKSEYSLVEFLEVIRMEPKITIANVHKERHQFGLETCLAEFAAVLINGTSRHTVAIESTDPDAVLELAVKLAIRDRPNTSYVRELKRLTAP